MDHRHRFPAQIISPAVWLYHLFSHSLRDVEPNLVKRGMAATHERIHPAARPANSVAIIRDHLAATRHSLHAHQAGGVGE
jgi:transposase-like protein